MTTHQPTITLIGGPTVLLHYAGLTFLTDPTFDPPGDYVVGLTPRSKLAHPAVTPDELPAIDAVLLSHDTHIDNLDHSGRELLSTMGTIISTPAAHVNIPSVTALRPWESLRLDSPFGDCVITAVPALHGPPEVEAIVGDVTGFVLEAEAWPTVYVSGDNASIDLVAEISQRFVDVAIAILFTGAARVPALTSENLTLDAAGAVQAAHLLDRATIIPVHAEGWSHYTQERDAIAPVFAVAGLADRLVMLPHGTSVPIGPAISTPA